jgi:lysozyme family protein
MVEHRAVAPGVAGSSPVGLPIDQICEVQKPFKYFSLKLFAFLLFSSFTALPAFRFSTASTLFRFFLFAGFGYRSFPLF